MDYLIRRATKADEQFLWQMLYYAAHMDEDGDRSADSARTNPNLAPYVANWGEYRTDLGFIAVEPQSGLAVGAAWIRPMPPGNPLYNHVAPDTPELAIAVAPGHLGNGIGSLLLTSLLTTAQDLIPTIALSVRDTNPAKRLYERFGFVRVGHVGTSWTMQRILD